MSQIETKKGTGEIRLQSRKRIGGKNVNIKITVMEQ